MCVILLSCQMEPALLRAGSHPNCNSYKCPQVSAGAGGWGAFLWEAHWEIHFHTELIWLAKQPWPFLSLFLFKYIFIYIYIFLNLATNETFIWGNVSGCYYLADVPRPAVADCFLIRRKLIRDHELKNPTQNAAPNNMMMPTEVNGLDRFSSFGAGSRWRE